MSIPWNGDHMEYGDVLTYALIIVSVMKEAWDDDSCGLGV